MMNSPDPENRLVIHIGPRKTATTYLQQNLYRARRELGRHRWIYPLISSRIRNAHHEVANARNFKSLLKRPIMKRLKAAVAKARSTKSGLLLSSEGFRLWKAKDLVALARHLGYSGVTIVWVLRDPAGKLASEWSETVKNGSAISLQDYFAKQTAKPSGLLNPMVELKPLLNTDGIDLRVLNYEAILASGEDIYSEFCRLILGLDGMTAARDNAANKRRPVEFTEFLAMLAPSAGRARENFGMMFGRAVERRLKDREIDAIVADIAALKEKAGRTVTLSRDEPWYRQMETELVESLGERLLPQAADGRIFPPGTLSLACYDRDVLAQDPKVAAHLRKSARKLRPNVFTRSWTKARLRLLSIRSAFSRLFAR